MKTCPATVRGSGLLAEKESTMSIPVSKRAAVHCSVVATLLLAGCGGLAGGLTPTAEKFYSVDGIVRPLSSGFALQRVGVRSLGLNLRFPPKRSKSETFYLSSNIGGVYDEFKLPNTEPLCKTSGAKAEVVNSIGTTSDGDVWLPSDGPPTGIIAYAPGCGAQTAFLSVTSTGSADPDPTGVVFGPSQTAYGLVGLNSPNCCAENGVVEVYPKGASSPQYEYTDARLDSHNGYGVGAIGINKRKVYVSCCGLDPYLIVFSASGRNQKHGKKIQLQGVSAQGGSISFDKASNMIMPTFNAPSLEILAPPYTGTPTTYPLQGTPGQCGLNPKETELACSNVSANTADIYSYPSMTYEYSVAAGSASNTVSGAAFVPSH
jgi:hypothetical protein